MRSIALKIQPAPVARPAAHSATKPSRSSLATSLTLAAMSLGYGVVQLDVTIVNTALNSIGTSLGGGIDYRLFRPIAWRFEGDYVHTEFFSTGQNDIRLTTGIVFRF